jgi:uncharacterized protein (DUF58 family)
MNLFATLGLGTIALIAAVALYFAGERVLAGVALAVAVVFDVLFAFAVRDAAAQRKKE